ncbi:hypothetical protein ACV357_32835, partial [Pseudomonas aeruginosa]
MATRLVRAGARRGDAIGVALNRSPEMIATIWGILRAGADQAGGHAARHMVEVAIGPALLLEGQRGAARKRNDLAFEQVDDVDQRLGLGRGVAARGEEGEVGGFVGMIGEAPQKLDEDRADQRGLAAADAATVAVDA